MEGGSVLSPSSWQRRRAWARQSRCWRTAAVEEEEEEEEEQKATAAMQEVPELLPPHLDDVFLEGSSSSKIETWLQACGPPVEVPPEELSLPSPCGCGTSFEDDLSLGAEAPLLLGTHRTRALRDLDLGSSMASSGLSRLTAKSSSSLSQLLQWCQEDPEEILSNLGFAQSPPEAVGRVPARFFWAPSRARGIDWHLFLTAQVQRMAMEDPCLLLPSRFQQVQALVASSDAIFCLYSYVSRTPLQGICPPKPSCPWHRCPHAHAHAHLGALSPAERLRKLVSTLCLYTSPRDDGHCPQGTSRVPASQRSAMKELLEEEFCFTPAHDALRGWGRGRGAHVGALVLPRGQQELAPKGTAPAGDESLVPACAHGQGRAGSPLRGVGWGRGTSCQLAAGHMGMEGHQEAALSANSPPTAGSLPTHVWGTPEHAKRLASEGDADLSSLGTTLGRRRRRRAWCQGCQLSEPMGTPGAHSSRAGGQQGWWSSRWHLGGALKAVEWQKGGREELQPPGEVPSPLGTDWQQLVDSFEMEEVLSSSEDEDDEGGDDDDDDDDDEGDAHPQSFLSLHPSPASPKGSMLHASSGQSDSSGFVEELMPGQVPAAHDANWMV